MHIQYVILKVRLLSNKIPDKKIDFSLEVHKTEISQMDLLSTMRQCGSYKNLQVGFQMNIINLTDFNMKLIMSAGITLLDNDKSMSF